MKIDKTFHYTTEEMARDLISLLPEYKSILDAGSGNLVWFRNLQCEKYECEIDRGCNFYEWSRPVEWVVGNPPYHESWKFTEHAIGIATKGVAWLLNNQALNSHLTPARLERLSELGWKYTKIHVVADKRWFGRYYFLILQKDVENDFISWKRATY